MQVWAQAAAKANSTEAKKVAAAIKAGSWDTVIGKISYTPKGDITIIDYVVYKWDRSGNYAEINPGRGS
jgi:branched-chain amino acid transport system substrate-binding protein